MKQGAAGPAQHHQGYGKKQKLVLPVFPSDPEEPVQGRQNDQQRRQGVPRLDDQMVKVGLAVYRAPVMQPMVVPIGKFVDRFTEHFTLGFCYKRKNEARV
jgi:hypothetical protein